MDQDFNTIKFQERVLSLLLNSKMAEEDGLPFKASALLDEAIILLATNSDNTRNLSTDGKEILDSIMLSYSDQQLELINNLYKKLTEKLI